MSSEMGIAGNLLGDELQDLRIRVIRWVAAGEIVLAYAVLFVWALNSDLSGPESPLVAVVLIVSVVLTLFFTRWRYAVAVTCLTLGNIVAVSVAGVLWHSPDVLYAYLLVFFFVPLLMAYRFALGVATIELALVTILAVLRLVPITGHVAVEQAILIVLASGLTMIAYQPMRVMVIWCWSSYQAERNKTEEVRIRQAELALLSKSLEDACERLEAANAALGEARRAAEEARRLKDEFATAISHELRTPINLIIGFSEMIADEASNDSRVNDSSTLRRDVETIYRNACHLSTLVDDVLDLGRLDARRVGLTKRWCSISAIVDEAVGTVQGLYDKAQLSVTVDASRDLPHVFVDPTRVRQVLINLLANAVRYVEEGDVRVVARPEGDDIVISVIDTGIGISAIDLPYVFERFHQSGQQGRRGGFGLGLAVSKQFVELHGGSMWVASELGKGTTFTFTLPCSDNVAVSAPSYRLRRLEVASGNESPTIILASADADAIRIFRRYLDGYRMRVVACLDDLTRDGPPLPAHAIVTANEIPPELALAVQACYPTLPIITCSLHTLNRARDVLGVGAFLSKPITTERLHSAIAQLGVHLRSVLIIDDDPEMTELLDRMIKVAIPDCRVHRATGVDDGLAQSGFPIEPRVDLVILDLLMPDRDGHEFVRLWLGMPNFSSVPIIVASAATDEDHDIVLGESVQVQRAQGLSVAETLAVVQGTLDRLVPGRSTRDG